MANQSDLNDLRKRIDLIQEDINSIKKKLDESGEEAIPAAAAPAPAPRARIKKESRIKLYLQKSVLPEFEQVVGGNILGKLGLLTLVLATVWFIKYAFDKHWINESARIYTGLIFGFGATAYGLWLARGRLRIIAHSIVGTGFAILYIAIVGAYYFYDLLGRQETFALLFVLSAYIALLAARANSQILYMFSLVGAFMAPVLLSRGENSYRFLLGYMALINAGFFAISFRRYWRVAPFVLLGADALVYGIWAAENLSQSSFTVPFLFLVFIFTMFMTRQTAVVPRLTNAVSRSDYILLPLVISFYVTFGIWAMNEFHRILRPHFILSIAGILALFYFIFNHYAMGVIDEKPGARA
jgi:uncharacterized membrane protein